MRRLSASPRARRTVVALLCALGALAAGCGGEEEQEQGSGAYDEGRAPSGPPGSPSRGDSDRDEDPGPARRSRRKGPAVAVIGDTPYSAQQVASFRTDIASINSDPHVRLAIHLGDIQEGERRCEDRYLSRIRRDFDTFDDPLVYTPGDNEWTDCHEASRGGHAPTERLARLRSIFFDRPGHTLGRRSKRVIAQHAPFVENVRWEQARTLFVTLHVVGSNNGVERWPPAAGGSRQPEANRARQRANLAWLDRAFDAARDRRAAAVVVAMQADMWPEDADHDETSGFDPIVSRLAARARAFRRPVLVLQGDSHEFKSDRPLARGSPIHGVSTRAPNLTRIVVQGEDSSEWLRLHLDPSSAEVFSWDRVDLGG